MWNPYSQSCSGKYGVVDFSVRVLYTVLFRPCVLYTVFTVLPLPPHLVKTLAKNLFNNLAKTLVKNLDSIKEQVNK